jgi:uncharacterized Zn finger protein (UPF0148 family)
MYILSNGVKITEKAHQRLCRAMKDTSRKYAYFLDMETGKLIRIPCAYRQKLVAIRREPQRFIPLPRVSEDERRKRFVAFVEELGIIDVPKLQSCLSKEIKKRASINRLEQILKNDPSGWIHGWVQDEQFLLAERIEEWITNPSLNAKDDPDYWFFDDCPVCQLMQKTEQEGRQPKTSELKDALDEAKKKGAMVGGEIIWKDDLEYIGNAKDFEMPKWMECAWRRMPCGKDDCPICGRIKRDRQRHIEKGEDPDDFKNVIEDVGQSFKEALETIKKDAESKGLDITNIKNIQEPPKPEEFPLYREIEKWNKSVMALGDTAQALGEFWIHTEEAADLFWYSRTLMAKTYRQLCNRWYIKNGDDYGDFDYQYTAYVLKECLKILKESLKELAENNQKRQRELNLIYLNLLKLEKRILKI